MNIKGIHIVVLLAAVVGAVVVGCTSQAQQLKPTLRFGIVHLERILPELEEYKQFSEQYVEDIKRLRQEVGTDPKKVQEFMKDEQHRQALEQSVQKWDVTRRKFLDKLSEDVRAASVVVAKQKEIDVVLVSAPWLPVEERMAYDITIEVLQQLKEDKNAPKATR